MGLIAKYVIFGVMLVISWVYMLWLVIVMPDWIFTWAYSLIVIMITVFLIMRDEMDWEEERALAKAGKWLESHDKEKKKTGKKE